MEKTGLLFRFFKNISSFVETNLNIENNISWRKFKDIIKTLFKYEVVIRMSEDEQEAIRFYAKKAQVHAVEIGTFWGGSTAVISKSLPQDVYLTTIDPYLESFFFLAKTTVKNTGNIRKVRFIKDYSFNIAKRWNKDIDFLFIDGSHKYEDVKKDFEDWAKFLIKGGYILFHDSNISYEGKKYGHEGPVKLVDGIKRNMPSQYKLVRSIDTLNVFEKI